MIQDVVLAVEKHFNDNWIDSEVNYDQPQFTPTSTKWVEIIVNPVLSENASFTCTKETFELHTLVYGANKVEAGTLADSVIAFLQNTQIDMLTVKTWGTIANGNLETDDTYFYKLYFECQA